MCSAIVEDIAFGKRLSCLDGMGTLISWTLSQFSEKGQLDDLTMILPGPVTWTKLLYHWSVLDILYDSLYIALIVLYLLLLWCVLS
jgi:hypothetical protein